jgi:predicted ATP-binding protein involved in virulence
MLRKINIKQYKHFKNFVIDIDNNHQWIVINSNNSKGKTTLLKAIALGLNGIVDDNQTLANNEVKIDIKVHNDIFSTNNEYKYNDFVSYGSFCLNSSKNNIENKTRNLFDNLVPLFNIEYRFHQHYKTISNDIFEKLDDIIDDVLKPNILSIETEIIKYDKNTVYFDIHNNKLSFKDLSNSDRKKMLIAGDILESFSNINQNWNNLEWNGIVLIDNFENDLDINNQKRFVECLSKYFPKIQFIITTNQSEDVVDNIFIKKHIISL